MTIDWRRVQQRLGVTVDGVPGRQTYAALLAKVAARGAASLDPELGAGMAEHLPAYAIDTPTRLAHFLGQTAHESGGFRILRELWGPTPEQRRYEGRRDLGNTEPGDGQRYRGRGLIQITGRANYRAAGVRLGLPLEASPAWAERPDIAVLVSCDWWQQHGCNALADANNAIGLGRLINRGSSKATRPANGEGERLVLTARAKALLV